MVTLPSFQAEEDELTECEWTFIFGTVVMCSFLGCLSVILGIIGLTAN